ncbi:protein of unknown function (DUF3493) [Rubidibacter lacunae KORDI 51-2]|uniref:DUF3493 domain-containing protein n=1 Tax=Rubidibacter lacunae KORDI 51-2 TaxID=582515 RepID=U5DP28_9CHRO|nr:DUF3493 domain-containing protein [Rubidibacter lacunae]ERN42587.1 protein of unknown function (DUF3493) [Rubidibacter lacunae KORDI 51-2]
MAESPDARTTEQRPGKEKYARLLAEAKAPYRGFRRFFYAAFAVSGAVGALVFTARLAAGTEVLPTLGNLALQLGLVAAMVFLFRLEKRLERRADRRDVERSR